MIRSMPDEENAQRPSFQENANWAAYGLDPIMATMSNVNPDAEAQTNAEDAPGQDFVYREVKKLIGMLL